MAEAYGAVGIRVEKADEVEAAIATALAETKRPVLLDFQTLTMDKVYPMIPAGQTVDQMMLMNGDVAPKVTVDTDAETWSFAEDEAALAELIKDQE